TWCPSDSVTSGVPTAGWSTVFVGMVTAPVAEYVIESTPEPKEFGSVGTMLVRCGLSLYQPNALCGGPFGSIGFCGFGAPIAGPGAVLSMSIWTVELCCPGCEATSVCTPSLPAGIVNVATPGVGEVCWAPPSRE